MRFFIILFIIILSNNLFSANFEFSFGGGAGTSLDFSYVKDAPDIQEDEGGTRIEDGITASGFLDIGANFELPNAGALSSVSVLFETGYNYYMRVRTRNKKYPEEMHRFFYHSLIFGILPKLNFDYGVSLGIGAGFFFQYIANQAKEHTRLI